MTELCHFVEKDNSQLGGANKWWDNGRAEQLVGYLVIKAELRAETGVRSLNPALHCRRGTETIQWMRSAG